MTPKVRKRGAGVARPNVNETSAGTGATGTADGVDAKTGSGAPQGSNPWPAQLGWDFPFDFPKPAR